MTDSEPEAFHFAATTSTSRAQHDLANRLAAALGYAQLLLRTELNAEQRAWVKDMIAACEGHDTLTLSRLANQLGIETAADLPGSETVNADVAALIADAVACLTDRRHGPASVIMSTASGTIVCSDCRDRVKGGGIQLESRMSLPSASERFDQSRNDCRHAHRTFIQTSEKTTVAIYRHGESAE